MKKYMDVVRHGKSSTHMTLEEAIDVVYQEKLDGANASFTLEDNILKAFSRNTELDEHNTLRGFYGWVMTHMSLYDHIEYLNKDYIYYGEWLVKHKIQYNEDAMGKFYLFDIFDKVTGKYLPYENVLLAAHQLELNLIPVFYKGPFKSLEHIQSFVGQSKLGPKGEGVVVKNTHYTDKHGNQLFTKFVDKEFSEMAGQKEHVVKASADPFNDFINGTVNKARVSKLLHKMVDEGLLEEDYAIEDMKVILKHIGSRVYDDIIKEELDELLKIVKGRVGKKVPSIVKEVLAEEERM